MRAGKESRDGGETTHLNFLIHSISFMTHMTGWTSISLFITYWVFDLFELNYWVFELSQWAFDCVNLNYWCELCVKLDMSQFLSLSHTHTRGIQEFRQLIKVKNSTQNVNEYSNQFELNTSDKKRIHCVSQSCTASCQIVFIHSAPNTRHVPLKSVTMATAEHSGIRTRTEQYSSATIVANVII